jgi:hypothetical protein
MGVVVFRGGEYDELFLMPEAKTKTGARAAADPSLRLPHRGKAATGPQAASFGMTLCGWSEGDKSKKI